MPVDNPEILVSTFPNDEDAETFLDMLHDLENACSCSQRYHDLGVKLFGKGKGFERD